MDEHQELMEELAIVAAGQHRMRFDLKLTIDPVVDIEEITAEEQRALERALQALLEETMKGKPLVQHRGRAYGAKCARLTRVNCGALTEPW